MDTIVTENLTKHYGKVHAAENISLCVKKAEIYGFLGLNGAGKTTTIRMLLGMINPTFGASYLNGKKVHAGSNKLWNSVGYLVEMPYSYPELTVKENLEIISKLRFIKDPGAVDSVIEKLRLGQYKNILSKNLSLGNAQRLGLAKALIHNPEILILDEPANGLDPAGIVEIRELLLDLAHNQGATIFISSHILGEISKFADRIGIIHEGRLIQEISIHDLESFIKRRLLICTRDNHEALSILLKDGFPAVINEGGTLELNTKEALASPEKLNELLVKADHSPSMLKVDEEDLETYFLRVISMNGGVQ
jgi:ABC-2 type transport system ATP-binding protein